MSEGLHYFVYDDGRFYGLFFDTLPDIGVEVPIGPPDSRMRWSFEREEWYWHKGDAVGYATENLNRDFNQAMQKLQAPWPLLEILTWDKQSFEAARWAAEPEDAKPETPFLTKLFDKCAALGAEDTFEALVHRVRENERIYTDAVTSIMAVRHVAENEIQASDEPMTITWQFPDMQITRS